MPTVIPEVDDSRIQRWVADLEAAKSRQDELLRTRPARSAMARIGDERAIAERDQAEAELRELRTFIGDTERAVWVSRNERRQKIAADMLKDREYRRVLQAAVVARAERLTAEGELVAVITAAHRGGIHLPPGLPAGIIADVDGVVRWAAECQRLGLLDVKGLPAWLRERLT